MSIMTSPAALRRSRCTILRVRTFENKRVIIPNSKMNSAIIENADYADSKVCVFLTVGITYESDLKKAKELLAREVRKQPAFLDIRTEQQKKDGVPDVPVVVLELADSASCPACIAVGEG